MMRNTFLLAAALAFVLPQTLLALPVDYNPQSVGAGNPEVHIKTDGTMNLKSGRVDQMVGTTLYLTAKWGELPMRFTMKTDAKTKVLKRYGGTASVSQIRVGDYLDADGDFFIGSDFFGFTAHSIRDWSLQEESETFSGTVAEVNSDSVVLTTPLGKRITVRLSSAAIKKGSVPVPVSRLSKGDTVLLADGVYDYSKNTLTAGQFLVFQPKTAFTARNYEGTLKKIDDKDLPTTAVVTVAGVDYRVALSAKTEILKKNRKTVELARFVSGDAVRFYGMLREEEKTLRDELVVDAEIIRNLNL